MNSGVAVKFVCANCNNGWMSELENRVKPVVESLLGDSCVMVEPAGQATLAVWAVKNAMVFEALRDSPPWFFTDLERSGLRESLLPPSRTSVWIAKCVEQDGVYWSASDLGGAVEGSAVTMRAFVTTMAFGPLAIQVLGGKLPDDVPLGVTVTADLRPGPWEQVAARIWPRPERAVAWPPVIGLSGEAGLEAFSERWGPDVK